jgi:hypothetical protein
MEIINTYIPSSCRYRDLVGTGDAELAEGTTNRIGYVLDAINAPAMRLQ